MLRFASGIDLSGYAEIDTTSLKTGAHYKEQLYAVILEHSMAASMDDAWGEWRAVWSDVHLARSNCICGVDIVHNCRVFNPLTKMTGVLGSTCIDKVTNAQHSYGAKLLRGIPHIINHPLAALPQAVFETAVHNRWLTPGQIAFHKRTCKKKSELSRQDKINRVALNDLVLKKIGARNKHLKHTPFKLLKKFNTRERAVKTARYYRSKGPAFYPGAEEVMHRHCGETVKALHFPAHGLSLFYCTAPRRGRLIDVAPLHTAAYLTRCDKGHTLRWIECRKFHTLNVDPPWVKHCATWSHAKRILLRAHSLLHRFSTSEPDVYSLPVEFNFESLNALI